MIYVAIVLAVALVVVVLGFLWFLKTVNDAVAWRERAWREERAELLERIQRPERVPASQRPRPPRRGGEDPRDLPGDLQRMAQVGAVVPTRDPDPS